MVRLPFYASFLPALLLTGCAWISKNAESERLDPDGDGVLLDEDCDDTDPGISAVRRWFADADGDGYGDPNAPEDTCTQPEGFVTDATDCDDSAADVYPGAPEVCGTVDQNCDGLHAEATVWYLDADQDGYGGEETAEACDLPEGYTLQTGDCDDGDALVSPEGVETCDTPYDDDCDGLFDTADDAPTWYADGDADGYGDPNQTSVTCTAPPGSVSTGTDCDDANSDMHPGADEACGEALDLNCDGFSGPVDNDGDSWSACDDCDDGDPTSYPGAPEYCDDLDNDCDLAYDEDGVDAPTWYEDADGDTYVGTPIQACDAPPGSEAAPTDCDDADATISPSALEICGGGDEDCDALVDDDDDSVTGTTEYYVDGDADSYGAGEKIGRCVSEPGLVLDGSDCDDTDPLIFPGADEYCGGGDTNCNGLKEDEDPLVKGTTDWYADADGDGYGVAPAVIAACAMPTGTSGNTTDCDDSTATTNPAGVETCTTAADDDCDGDSNELNVDACALYYLDADQDGYGSTSSECRCVATGDYDVFDATDCDDGNGAISPDGVETCSTSADDDCDGDANDPSADGCITLYLDDDRDGYGTTVSECRCSVTGNYDSPLSTDCDDAQVAAYPGGPETWYDGIDGDCSRTSDYDQDLDGYEGTSYGGADCDDANASLSPSAAEICNDGLDNDCDGTGGACVWSGTLSVMSSADAVIYGGDGSYMYFGFSLSAGEIDGSVGDDLLVGAPGWNGGDGSAYQFVGANTGVNSSSIYTSWLYSYNQDSFGHDVAVLEGTAQQIYVSEPYNDDNYTDGGATWMFYSPNSGYSSSNSCQVTYGAGGSTQAAWSVAAVTDQTGDGAAEVVIGAPDYGWSNTQDGSVTLHSRTSCYSDIIGVESGWYGRDYLSRLGWDVAVGDLTGDGLQDVIASAVGDSSDAGGVYILEMATAGYGYAPSSATAEWQGAVVGDGAGYALAVTGDVTGDGIEDLLIGAPGSDTLGIDAGAAYLVAGGSTGVQSLTAAYSVIVGEAAYLRLGSSVAALDLDSDGEVDLAVGGEGTSGASSYGTDVGHALLFYGPIDILLGSASADVILEGYAEDQLGSAMTVGDMNNDGREDWVIGAPQDSYWAYTQGGAVYTLYGKGN